MVRIARSVDGATLIGDSEGFIPLRAVDEQLSGSKDAITSDIEALTDPDAVPVPRIPSHQITFTTPLSDVGKLWGIGLNYKDHAANLEADYPDEPASFMKPATTVTGPGGPIRLPPEQQTSRVTAEAELGIVIGRQCKDIRESEVAEVLAGFVPVIDMTAEDILEKNPRFLTRSKSFDTFFLFGPWIVTPEEIEDISNISVRTIINNELIAKNEISEMMFSPRELVAFHSRVMTLKPGDIISTGTPGAGHIKAGDTVRAEIDSIGTVTGEVVRATD